MNTPDHLIVAFCFVCAVAAFTVLSMVGTADVTVLRDVILALAAGLVGLSRQGNG